MFEKDTIKKKQMNQNNTLADLKRKFKVINNKKYKVKIISKGSYKKN